MPVEIKRHHHRTLLLLPFLGLLWNSGDVVANALNIDLAVVRALDDEVTH